MIGETIVGVFDKKNLVYHSLSAPKRVFSAHLSMITLATMVNCLACVLHFQFFCCIWLVYHSFVAEWTFNFRSSDLSSVISGHQIILYIFLHTPGVFYKKTSVRAAVDKFVVIVVEAIDMVLSTSSIRTWKLPFWFSRYLKMLSGDCNCYELSRTCKSD